MAAAHSTSASSRQSAEAFRRQVYVATVTLAGLADLVVTVLDALHGHPPQWPPVMGILLCAGLVTVLLQRRLPLQRVAEGALVTASVVVAAELIGALHTGVLELRLYFAGIFLILTAFSVLTLWYAALYSAVLYFSYVVLVLLNHGDVSVLAELALTVFLIAHLSVFGAQVSAERAEAKTSQLLASTDFLTSLANRRAMYPLLEAAFHDGAEDRQTAVLLLDIDHFKRVNDRHGHPVGDEVLREFALVLQQGVGAQDIVSRWGGEEFLILLPDSSMRAAIDRAEKLLQRIRQAAMPSGLQITASCGVAHAQEAESVEEWLLCVDQRLYVAKGCGRDQVASLDQCRKEFEEEAT